MTNETKKTGSTKGLLTAFYLMGVSAIGLVPTTAQAKNIYIVNERRPGPRVTAQPIKGGNRKAPSTKQIINHQVKRAATSYTGQALHGIADAAADGTVALAEVTVGNIVDFGATGITKGIQGLKEACFGKDSQEVVTTTVPETGSSYTFVYDTTNRQFGYNGGHLVIVPDRRCR